MSKEVALFQFSLRMLLFATTFVCLFVWCGRSLILNPQTLPDGRLAGHFEREGEPFETTVLIVSKKTDGFSRQGATGPDGDFSIQLPPGIYDFYASLDGLDDVWDAPSSVWRQVSVLPGKTVELPPFKDFQLAFDSPRLPNIFAIDTRKPRMGKGK
jgi:hypothetical protein